MRKILLTAVFLAAGAASAAAQHQDKDKRGLVWDDRPTIVFGEDITVGIRGRLQLDWRQFNPGVDEDTFDFRTARIGLQGDVTRHFSYEIEREVDREAQFGDWKDVYLPGRPTMPSASRPAGSRCRSVSSRTRVRRRPTSPTAA